MEEIKVNIDGKEHVVSIEEEGNSLKVHLGGKTYQVETSGTRTQDSYDVDASSDTGGEGTVKAALPGVIFSIGVKEGQAVKKGDTLLSLVAMKMENQVKAPITGTVKKISVKKDDKVAKGDTLLVLG